jgi:large subunit ribosomal protein L18
MVKAEVGGDRVIVAAGSGELIKNYGWQGGEGNIPAAYLTGLLCGFKAAANGVEEAVFDLGLHAPTKGSRVFAALKGALDGGVMIHHDKDKLPDEKRIQGLHVAEYAKQLSSSPDVYQKQFAERLSRSFHPEEMAEHFSQVKQKISSSFPKAEVVEERGEEKPSEGIVEKEKKPRSRVAAKRTAKPRVKKQESTEKLEEKK